MFKVYAWVLEKDTYLIGSHKFRIHVETLISSDKQRMDEHCMVYLPIGQLVLRMIQ